jgi:hypothetical protein
LLITLEIKSVSEVLYWDCTAGDTSCGQTYKYDFFASTNANGGCEVQLCDPDLANEPALTANEPALTANAIQDGAVAFSGDIYDDRTHKIQSVSASKRCPSDRLDSGETDIINFACMGTTVSKLYMMRHTAASARPEQPTTVSQRQAMLSMLTAEYCGNGQSFAENGTPIRFRARGWRDFGGYGIGEGRQQVEAVWTDRGARCIDDLRSRTSRFVRTPACSPPRCRNVSGEPTDLLVRPPQPPHDACDDVSGDYIVSTIPSS